MTSIWKRAITVVSLLPLVFAALYICWSSGVPSAKRFRYYVKQGEPIVAKIEEFRRREGRLPKILDEAGAEDAGFDWIYALTDADHFLLYRYLPGFGRISVNYLETSQPDTYGWYYFDGQGRHKIDANGNILPADVDY